MKIKINYRASDDYNSWRERLLSVGEESFLERAAKGAMWKMKWLQKRHNKEMEGVNNEFKRIASAY